MLSYCRNNGCPSYFAGVDIGVAPSLQSHFEDHASDKIVTKFLLLHRATGQTQRPHFKTTTSQRPHTIKLPLNTLTTVTNICFKSRPTHLHWEIYQYSKYIFTYYEITYKLRDTQKPSTHT